MGAYPDHYNYRQRRQIAAGFPLLMAQRGCQMAIYAPFLQLLLAVMAGSWYLMQPRNQSAHSMATPRTLLVTSALPYANGPIHLGHLVEYIQTDIWVRFQRSRGHHCLYLCADDAHGTPIMLRAEREGITPEALIERIGAEHRADFADFHISFDNYHTTHSAENRELATLIYERLRDGGHISRRTITQAYDPLREMFLPDRFIKGGCPRCGAADQYGDSCEVCGATYTPADLVNPVSAISGATPVTRESEHLFFRLGDFTAMLSEWLKGPQLQREIAHKLQEWFAAGLQDWDISRDAPYFGFEIPDAAGKFFYVWLDAPIGYMASLKNLASRQAEIDFNAWWGRESQAEIYHFIGKDIAYFHTLFWPAMLHGAGFRPPTAVFCHGFLTVNGQKMSKSRGTFIMARSYLDHLDPEYLRYYFAAKLGSGIDDIDLNLEDFSQRVNSDLVGKLVNLASRCAGFIHKRFAGRLGATVEDETLLASFIEQGETIASHYEGREYGQAIRQIMALADRANEYIDARKPWLLAKQSGTESELQAVATLGLNLYRILIAWLKPVLPALAARSESFLAIPALDWQSAATPLLDHTINPFTPLLGRIEPAQITALIAASAETMAPAVAPASSQEPVRPAREAIAATITVDDLARIDLRVGLITSASLVNGADKLLQLAIDLGDNDERQIFAGIRSAYDPASLVGRLTVVVANLAPRKMKFGTSEGMVLAAGPGGSEIYLLSADSGAVPGMRIR
jgi:methionyl-tRNA synthetase